MAEKILMEACDVWDFFHEHKMRESYKLLGCNDPYGIEVYLTSQEDMRSIVVTADGDEIYSEEAVSERDCRDTVQKIYNKYLSDEVLTVFFDDDEDFEGMMLEDTMEQRELELSDAVITMAEVFAEGHLDKVDDIDELAEVLKDLIAEFLYTEYGLSCYRPMFLEDELGNEEYVEFPYPELDLD